MGGAQLAAQAGDVDVDRAAVADVAVAPDRGDQLVPTVDPVRVRHQVGQQLEFQVRQVQRAALDLRVPLRVDLAAGPNWLEVEEVRA